MPNSRDPDLALDLEVTAASATTRKNKIVKQDDESRKQVLVQTFLDFNYGGSKEVDSLRSLYSFVKGYIKGKQSAKGTQAIFSSVLPQILATCLPLHTQNGDYKQGHHRSIAANAQQTQQPKSNAASDQPNSNASSDQPNSNAATAQPNSIAATAQPNSIASTDETISNAATDQPISRAASGQPIYRAASGQPIYRAASGQPNSNASRINHQNQPSSLTSTDQA